MPTLHRYHKIAAEIWGYSYQRYEEKVEIGQVRFSEMMPEDVRALEAHLQDGTDIEELADTLDCDVDAARKRLEDYRKAVAIVDADNPADALREGVRQTVRLALEYNFDDEETAEYVAHQLGYRAADLGYDLEQSDERLADYTDELRGGSDYSPPMHAPGSDGSPDEEARREALRNVEERQTSTVWAEYAADRGHELERRIQSGQDIAGSELDALIEATSTRPVPDTRPVDQGEEYPGIRLLESAAYHGHGPKLVDAMDRGWPTIIRAAIEGEAVQHFAWLGRAVALVEDFADAPARDAEQTFDEFDRLFRPDVRPRYRTLLEHMRGDRQFDRQTLEAIDLVDYIEPAFHAVGECIPRLLDAGWSPARAALGLVTLWDFLADVLPARAVDPDVFATAQRRRGSRMRRRLADALPLVVDPDECAHWIDRLAGAPTADRPRWPHRRGVFIEIQAPWLDHLEERELVDGRLADSLRFNLRKRLEDHADALASRTDNSTLAEGLRRGIEALG